MLIFLPMVAATAGTVQELAARPPRPNIVTPATRYLRKDRVLGLRSADRISITSLL